jgi:hypothetical protein
MAMDPQTTTEHKNVCNIQQQNQKALPDGQELEREIHPFSGCRALINRCGHGQFRNTHKYNSH